MKNHTKSAKADHNMYISHNASEASLKSRTSEDIGSTATPSCAFPVYTSATQSFRDVPRNRVVLAGVCVLSCGVGCGYVIAALVTLVPLGVKQS